MNSISIDRSGVMYVCSPPTKRDAARSTVETAIARYADSSNVSASTAGAVHKDYAAIARALLARLDALRVRATHWQERATVAIAPSSADTAAPTPAAASPATHAFPAHAAASAGGASQVVTGASPDATARGFNFNDRSNASISSASLNATEYGILVDNQQTSENVTIDGFTARNVQRYGMYLGAVRNWSMSNLALHQAAGASEHGLRIADGERITLRDSTIDTTGGRKSSMWLINVNDALVERTTFTGGAIRLGARPADNQGAPTASNIVIRDSIISKVSGGDAEAIQVWPGSNHIHLANLDITLETSGNWLSIDSRNVGNITWENIRVNGRLITGFEGVKLGGLSQAEALARGIGPLSS